MSLFSDNIRSLRLKKKISQEKVAESLLITRGRYAKYEDGTSEAPYEILKRISKYYEVSIDILLCVDIRKIKIDELVTLENNKLLLPVIVSDNGENFIEIVTQKAKAGYMNGYSDPEYIESLPRISLPFLGPGLHRGFTVDGDSMPPHEDGDVIVGKYIERLGEVVDGRTYIIMTKNDGIVYKRLNKNKRNLLVVESDESFYIPYEVKASEIDQIWEYKCNVGKNDKKRVSNIPISIEEMFMELKKDIRRLELQK
ncbi:XRE family transcriptional regulator [Flavobacterium pectinovorum]|uniref:Transcriptional regulator, contains XRE-family HTH domain n=1 Tax=Flavobacterium pectinovorum TaxID=29533 RepID=A0AB36P636_9FLAO|nr:LexA family transcriptional regulator [Flavobacterium pectinovorum]OXB07815.1 XRE family transcriptional regulator [Flavobacterium pectinovorum]SHM81368.1 Transcriptional regulator, contains XRE-family HTH domain [Flavobacterium pectinovorum]